MDNPASTRRPYPDYACTMARERAKSAIYRIPHRVPGSLEERSNERRILGPVYPTSRATPFIRARWSIEPMIPMSQRAGQIFQTSDSIFRRSAGPPVRRSVGRKLLRRTGSGLAGSGTNAIKFIPRGRCREVKFSR